MTHNQSMNSLTLYMRKTAKGWHQIKVDSVNSCNDYTEGNVNVARKVYWSIDNKNKVDG